MCGRFSLYEDKASLADRFHVDEVVPDDFSPRSNVAPTLPLVTIASSRDSLRSLVCERPRWIVASWLALQGTPAALKKEGRSDG